MVSPFNPKNFQNAESKKEIPPGVEELQKRIEKIESVLEKTEITSEKENIVKKEIKSYLEELQKLPSFAPPTKVRDEAKEIKNFSPPQQVGALIALVFEKGIKEAISVAKALDNPAILDEFHDVLVDRYYQILVEKGILKPF